MSFEASVVGTASAAPTGVANWIWRPHLGYGARALAQRPRGVPLRERFDFEVEHVRWVGVIAGLRERYAAERRVPAKEGAE